VQNSAVTKGEKLGRGGLGRPQKYTTLVTYIIAITSSSLCKPRAPNGFVWGRDAQQGRGPENVTNSHRCGLHSALNLIRKHDMAPESINKDSCALGASEVVCAARAGIISAGASTSYR